MPDLTLILIVLAIVLAVVGAIRFDLFGLILQEFRRPPPEAHPPEAVQRVHAPPQKGPGGDQHAADKPAFHRSGKRH
ncbi:hypothetical protein HNP55_004614 [Paucibacter oligotrophus]|uniref:Uncharacterized protein n=1 Tax=Roseateles oligotrophus TaxID=1769250 RepID=A0A840LD17_9BURK|nr:hypothetical protein [Roseateles oligotrophus]MBB4846060.1 hypothetical protein [Roseateles oligotrophus]